MAKIYEISTAEFADKHGSFELIGVLEQRVFVESKSALKAPFKELKSLPESLQKDIEAKLEGAKTSKIRAINEKRDEMINAGVTYKEHIFQSAKDDRDLLTSAAVNFQKLGQTPESFVWISKDNALVPFNLDDLFALGAKMAQNVNDNVVKARELKDKVLKAKNLKEVEAVKWD